MIIHSLSAENLLKYRRLRLTGLPQEGVIAIGGANESGKSSIGESLCFALFGRTFAVEPKDIRKLIRWGENQCSVTLQFYHGEQLYELTRMLDRDGNQAARLARVDSPEPPLARGAEAVETALADLLGYEYDEFVESFYLAQREFSAPHPHSYSLKVMAGIAPLEYCQAEFEEEIEQERALVESADIKLAQVQRELDELGFDTGRLARVGQDREALAGLQQDLRSRREPLASAFEDYQAHAPRLRAVEASHDWSGLLRLLFLVLSVLCLGFWALLSLQPDLPLSQTLQAWIKTRVPDWPAPLPWFLYGGLGSALLFLFFWVRRAFKGRRARALRDCGARLAAALLDLDDLETRLPPELTPRTAAPEGTEAGSRADPEIRTHLRSRIQEVSAAPDEAGGGVARDTAWLDQTAGRALQRLAALDEEHASETERQTQYERLTAMQADFQAQRDAHWRRIQERELADQLASAAMRHMSDRFNQHLRELVGRTLPLFTEGRYQHLQIDDNLAVRAFSGDKRDFLDLDEISSGTQRQIMLALRLALTQELINRVVQGRQFLFLDEPFVLFDEARTRSTLTALPKLSTEVTQIWVIAQQFPEDLPLAARIRCSRDVDHLLFAG